MQLAQATMRMWHSVMFLQHSLLLLLFLTTPGQPCQPCTDLQGILHRAMAALDQPSVIEQINPKIPVARGYYCETIQQLLDAYKLLGVKDAVLKPVFGAAGAPWFTENWLLIVGCMPARCNTQQACRCGTPAAETSATFPEVPGRR